MLFQIKIASAAAAAVYLTGCSSDDACDGQKYQEETDDGTCTGIKCSGPDGDYADVDCAQLGLDSDPSVSNVLCRDSDGNAITEGSDEGTCARENSSCDGECAAVGNENNPYQDDLAYCVAQASGDDAANCSGASCTGGVSAGFCGNGLTGATETLYCVVDSGDTLGTAVATDVGGKCAAGITAYDTADDTTTISSCTADTDCSDYTKVDDVTLFSSCSCAVGSVGLDSATAFSADSSDPSALPTGVCVCIPVDDSEN